VEWSAETLLTGPTSAFSFPNFCPNRIETKQAWNEMKSQPSAVVSGQLQQSAIAQKSSRQKTGFENGIRGCPNEIEDVDTRGDSRDRLGLKD
jgi:hypothetical protein